MKKIHRVLIVDDSVTMQHLIARALGQSDDIEVVGCASNALEAREAIKRLDPDVVTLDVEMPQMNGIEFLEKLMRLRPTPVIMVSNHTAASADLTVQAMAMGAIDCIAKPQLHNGVLFEGLPDKIRAASAVGWNVGEPYRRAPLPAAPREQSYVHDGRIVAIGASAGGIEALSEVLELFPANGPPVLIVQHMPASFTRSLAARLDRLSDAMVREAEDGAPLRPGTIYLAPGGSTHLQVVGTDRLHCRLQAAAPVSGHRPSVDVLFESVAKAVGPMAIGVILSGMGKDGAAGLLSMLRAGARTIGQDETTSFIYGMPRAAFEIGAVERQLPLEKIRHAILGTTLQKGGNRPCR